MPKIAVIYYSRTGNTKMMAERVAEAAKEAGGDVKLLPVQEATLENLRESANLLRTQRWTDPHVF